MTLQEIASSSRVFLRADSPTKNLMLQRLLICDTCPNKRQLRTDGALQQGGENRPDSIYYCGQCGCPLLGKTREPEHECPMAKWGVAEESYY
jgi:hypothetical protein